MTSSGSAPSARPVEPTKSQKSTVTTFRSSAKPPGRSGSARPQEPQKRAPAAASAPHPAHRDMSESLDSAAPALADTNRNHCRPLPEPRPQPVAREPELGCPASIGG